MIIRNNNVDGEDSITLSESARRVYHEVELILQRPEYCMLFMKETIAEDAVYLSISREACAVLEGIGPVDNPRLLLKFNQEVSYAFQVHFDAVESGEYDEELVRARIDQLVPSFRG